MKSHRGIAANTKLVTKSPVMIKCHRMRDVLDGVPLLDENNQIHPFYDKLGRWEPLVCAFHLDEGYVIEVFGRSSGECKYFAAQNLDDTTAAKAIIMAQVMNRDIQN